DHLNLTGRSPLAGPPPSIGQRFTDLTGLYSPRLRALAHEADPSLTEGIYAMMPGPHYETPAEITMLGRLGADLVGMSTVLEAIAARHMGAEVRGISLVTNLAAGLAGQSPSHAEVVEAGPAPASPVRAGSTLSTTRGPTSRAACQPATPMAAVISRPTTGSAQRQPIATPPAPASTASEVNPSVRACRPSATSAAEPILRPVLIRYLATSSLPAKPSAAAIATAGRWLTWCGCSSLPTAA